MNFYIKLLLISLHFSLLKYKNELGVKEAGLIKQEGKEYIVKDGDIMLFKFNVTS